jgi:hypothetical protein
MTVSASGVRIQGDDYQHLFAWYQAIRLLLPDHDVDRVDVESENAGNVDDVVVRARQKADEYVQVKYSTDASKPITSEWFTKPRTANGKSPLQRFSESWARLRSKGTDPGMMLFTNRVLDPADPILCLRDGQRATLGLRLAAERPGSAAGKQRAAWAAHLHLSEKDLIEMLSRLSIRTDQGGWSGLLEASSDRMRAIGLRAAEVDVETGVSAIRSWVKDGVREIDRDRLQAEIERRGLRGGEQYATLLVEAIDHAPWPDAAQIRLDWVDLFDGSEARARRQLLDPSQWSSKLRPEMVEAARALKAGGADRVLVRGYMRLPLWFLAGVELPDVRGHHVACKQRGQWWSSEVTPSIFDVVATTAELGQGSEIAIGLSVTNPVGADVIGYCRENNLPISRYVDLSPVAGPGPTSIPTNESAVGWALSTRDAIRAAKRSHGATKVHLFMSGPAGAAMMLGHFWNRVGPTLVYEDLSPGYAPTFEVP